jgi:hypothetical protein
VQDRKELLCWASGQKVGLCQGREKDEVVVHLENSTNLSNNNVSPGFWL